MKTCKEPNCDNKHYAKGMCNKHYLRWWKYGDTAEVKVPYANPPMTEELFHSMYEKQPSGCWHWTGQEQDGYGRYYTGGDRICATHLALQYCKGIYLAEDEIACHSCDNPICVNPDHLWAGSKADNSRDKVSKNRQAKGSQNRSKLTEADVLAIRKDTRIYREIAKDYGISLSQIKKIRAGISWAWLS